MSKSRLQYERELSDAQVAAHHELTDAQLELARARLQAEQDLRRQADEYERRLTDAQFHQLSTLAEEHRTFHEREHILYEDAIDKASASLQSQLKVLEMDVDRLRETAATFMTIERFEREHKVLTDKMDAAIGNLSEKVGTQERQVVKETTKDEVLAGVAQNNRWLVGLLVGNGLTLGALVLHLLHLY